MRKKRRVGQDHKPGPPISESATVQSETTMQPHPLYPNRWSNGTQRPSADGIARKYPKVERDNAAVAQVIAEMREAIACDRGGRENLTTLEARGIDLLVDCDLMVQAWIQYFREHRPYTRQGRTRSGYQAYLSTLDRWMRLAQIVGTQRVPKDANQSLDDWLHRDGDDANNDGNDGGHEDEQEHSATGGE